MSIMNSFIFANLKHLFFLGEGTSLSVYEPTGMLYVVKKAPAVQLSYIKRIMNTDNPHLAKILYIDEASCSFVTEYISGESLASVLKRRKILPENEALLIAEQVCEGLSFLHSAGIVHRDINPNNIIISSDGAAKITDYGIVRSYAENKTGDTVIMGTPGYAAPEQFGFTQSNAQTDIYALGVLLNVMLTGKIPSEEVYGGRTGEIIKRCTEIDSGKRYRSVKELSLVLKGSIKPSGSGADNFLSLIPGFRSGNPRKAAFSAVAYMAAAVMMIYFIFTEEETLGLPLRLAFCILHVILPFVFCCNMFGIWDALPSVRYSGEKTKKTIFYSLAAASVALFYILASFIFPLIAE